MYFRMRWNIGRFKEKKNIYKNQPAHVDSIHLRWEQRVKKRLARRFFYVNYTCLVAGPLY